MRNRVDGWVCWVGGSVGECLGLGDVCCCAGCCCGGDLRNVVLAAGLPVVKCLVVRKRVIRSAQGRGHLNVIVAAGRRRHYLGDLRKSMR